MTKMAPSLLGQHTLVNIRVSARVSVLVCKVTSSDAENFETVGAEAAAVAAVAVYMEWSSRRMLSVLRMFR